MYRKQTISYKLPFNLKESDSKLFHSISKERVFKPTIQRLKKCFVTYDGLLLRRGILNSRCAFNLIGKSDTTYYFTFWMKTLEQFIVSKFGKSIKSISLDNKDEYLLIHSKWFNYGFWVNDFIGRLIEAESTIGFNRIKLIFPSDWDTIPFVKESLEAFTIDRMIIPKDHHLFVQRLILPSTRQYTASFDSHSLNQIRDRMVLESQKRTTLKNSFDRIYLSRKQRGVRVVLNENEVVAFLKKNNFEVVHFEELGFWDQIYMMSQAKIFISIHGAGFSNVLFMPKKSFVIEFLEYDFAHYANPFPHWKLAVSAGLEYLYMFCKSDLTEYIETVEQKRSNPDRRNELVNRNIYVDIKELENNLNRIISVY